MRQSITNVLVIITMLTLSFGTCAKGKEEVDDPVPAVQLKDANDNVIGRIIGMDYIEKPYVLTNEGYRTVINIHDGHVMFFGTPYFVQVGCMGDAYIGLYGPIYLGVVYRLKWSDDSYELFYTPHNEPHLSATIYSYRDLDGNCYDLEPPVEKEIWPVYENIPDVTGIENSLYPTKMLIE